MFDNPRNVKGVVYALILLCAALFLSDLLVDKSHVHFPHEAFPAFYSVYGFVSCVVLVLIAKYILRPLVIREENYYDEQ